MKVCVTVGQDKEGRHRALYVGENADLALRACVHPPGDIERAEMYRNPIAAKRRDFAGGAVREGAAFEDGALESDAVKTVGKRKR